MADRIARREEAFSHRRIDDSYSGTARGLGFVPEPALQQRNLQYREIIIADPVHAPPLISRTGLTQEFELVVPPVGGRRGVGGQADHLHLGHGGDPLLELGEVLRTRLPCGVAVVVQRYPDRHDVVHRHQGHFRLFRFPVRYRWLLRRRRIHHGCPGEAHLPAPYRHVDRRPRRIHHGPTILPSWPACARSSGSDDYPDLPHHRRRRRASHSRDRRIFLRTSRFVQNQFQPDPESISHPATAH